MLKEFLTQFSLLVGETQINTILDPDSEPIVETVSMYESLSEEEKEAFFEIVKSFEDNGSKYRLYFEFVSLHFYKDRRYADDILECLLTKDFELAGKLNYYAVLGREMFVNGIVADYGKQVMLESILTENVIKKAAVFPDYISYDERDHKTVVIIIRPFLGEYHSPSLQTINLDNYLRKLGYETFYVSYCENEILVKYSGDVCSPFTRSNIFKGINRFEYSCFDRVINGMHFDIRADSVADDFNALAVYISQMKPEFIIGIEGGNILADICTKFTDVISMNVVDDLPVTLSEYVLRYFPGEYKNGYLDAEKYGKKVFEAVYDNELNPYNDEESEIPELDENRFNICIMGNRLDDEINDEMLGIIRRIVCELPQVSFLFIGDCPKTRDKLTDISNRCIFAGYVKRCEDAVASCNLFLNPPRKGGGGGGYMAIKRGVPVYTLGNCDVASCAGEEFSHDSFDELIPFIRRCLEDKNYYEEMCRASQESFNTRYRIDSLSNVASFCDSFKKQISGSC